MSTASPISIQQAFDLALQHHQSGRLPEAERLYREVLARQPGHAHALHFLGVLAGQSGHNDAAADLIRRAIAALPDYPEAFNNLGMVLQGPQLLDQRVAAFRKSIALRPDFADPYANLGGALKEKGRLDEAIAACRQAISLRATFPEAYNNLGGALREKGMLDEAVAACRHAIFLRPNYAEAYCNLASALSGMGHLDAALDACRRGIALKPNLVELYNHLGDIFKEKGKPDEALAAFEHALALRPDDADTLNNVGAAYREKGDIDDAIDALRRAIAARPEQGVSHSNLGGALKEAGRLDEAIAAFRQAIALQPGLVSAHSNLVYTLHFHPDYSAAQIAAEHREWNRLHAEPLRPLIQPHRNDNSPHRRLRIGYVSPDFRDHVVGRNLLPLFKNHDRRQFEIICYANVPSPDWLTREFQGLADGWRNIVGRSDEQVAATIRQDAIDVLVDLALHMARGRLPVFARKPAPVQVTFAGYPASTGLTAIDYRLSDPYLDPPPVAIAPDSGTPRGEDFSVAADESQYSEKTIRLPDSFWCYDPFDTRDMPVPPLPALAVGAITFGCLNNFTKVNARTLDLWARALVAVKNSRLLLLANPGSHRQRVVERLALADIDAGRIEFLPPQSRRRYLEYYSRIDIGLDTHPYNGHTTSLDSFWMGVPVVTLVGNTPVSRAGWCQLSNLGLTEMAAMTGEQFVKIAVDLAEDIPGLAALRQSLRERMLLSPLMDGKKFAREIESAYSRMWSAWCETPGEVSGS